MAGIPQVITEDRASGALVIDGSLKFNGRSGGNHGYGHLKRTSSGASGAGTFTISWWAKRGSMRDDWQYMIAGNNGSLWGVGFPGSSGVRDSLTLFNGTHQYSSAIFRDNFGWYHIVLNVNSSTGAQLWVNGELQSNTNNNNSWNLNNTMYIGKWNDSGTPHNYDGYLAQYTCIDGLELGPAYFAYTDPLTGTWRPKKFRAEGTTVNDGTNWSSSVSNAANSATNLFDGSTTTYTEGNVDGTPVTWSGNVSGSKIEFYAGQAGSTRTFTVNGVDRLSLVPTTAGWFTVPDVTSLTAFTFSRGGSGNYVDVFAVRVDGVIMTNNTTQNLAFGNAGFYLPLDGNTPIGKDQSGNGNDWEVVGFGGSQELSKATGAIPILNTNEAGTVDKPGARTDSKTYTVTASGGNYYLDGVLKPTLNAYRGSSLTFDYTGATSHPFYLSSLQDGKWNSKAYSVEFGGSDYLSVPDSDDFDLAGNDWTIEAFVYHSSTNYASYEGIIGQWTDSSGTARTWILETVGSGATSDLEFYYYDTSNNFVGPVQGGTLTKNTWHHVAACRSGNTIRMFVDGVMYGSGTSISVDIKNATNDLTVGGNVAAGGYWNGHISNVRVVNGTALYTTNFTPPSTTLTNVTNTKLLCCQDSDATTGAVLPSGSAITVNGSAAASQTRQPFLYDNNHGNFGLNLSTSNTTKITIPHTAADTLYYYCNAHSGMGSSINVTTDIFKADPYAWKCVLAVPLTGPDNIDLSSDINVTTNAMTVASSSVTSGGNRNFYGSSAFYGTNANQYRHEISANSGLSFGDRPWTIECWCYRDSQSVSNTYQTLWSFRSNTNSDYHQAGWISFLINSSSSLFWYYGTGSGNANFSPTEKIALNRWTHIASVWDGAGNIELYFDGIKVHTQAISKTDWGSSTLPFYFGDQAYDGGVRGLSGYMQDFRVYKGVAKYSENFVPASTDPDILPDTPSGISSKSKLTKITDGAVAFDGGDFLQIPASEDLNVGSADFTAEAWVYPTQYGEIVGAFNLNAPYNGWLWSLSFDSAGGKQMIWFDGNQQKSTSVVPLNKWSHIAFSKSGTTVKYFLDGKLDGSFTASANSTWSNQVVHIGADSNSLTSPGRNFHGFISNLRLIKGTALYTSNFTPPTEPLTEVTNTKLLCCQSTTSATAAAVTPAAFTPPRGGYRFTTAKIYSTYGGGARAANYTIQWSDDNSSWTDAWSGNMSNNSSCGLQQGTGAGNPGSHRYWRYVEGSATTGHHPRVSRIVLSDGTTDVNIKVYVADNCSDNGDYQIGTTTTYEDTTWTAGHNSNAIATNFNPFTDDINAIRGQETGYATLNPLSKHSDIILSNGNLTFTNASSAGWRSGGSIGHGRPSSGKYYFETQLTTALAASSYNHFVGVLIQDNYELIGGDFGSNANGYLVGAYTGSFRTRNNARYGPSVTKTTTTGTILQVAIDVDNGKLWFGCDNVWASGSPYSNTSPSYTFTAGTPFSPHFAVFGANASMDVNFGQKPFKFPPPDGFQPLNASTVGPSTVVARPDQYVKPVLYSGTGSDRDIDLGLNADFLWFKNRAGDRNTLIDTVRGDDGTRMYCLVSELTTDEATRTESTTAVVKSSSWPNNGIRVGTNGQTNSNGSNYLVWAWKAGGNKNTYNIDDVGYATASAAGLDAGNIALDGASVGTKQGFSILKWAGTSAQGNLPHGLTQDPDFIVIKGRDNSSGWWQCWHRQFGTGSSVNRVYFNDTIGQDVSTTNIFKPNPGAGTILLNTGDHFFNGAFDYIGYAWHDVPGLQKFGSYVGNTTAGPFVELGFRPAILWIKCVTQNWYWAGFDSQRPAYNPNDGRFIHFNNSNGESSGVHNNIDFLSNGFRIRSTSTNSEPTNLNGQTYIYCAWAEAPSTNLYGAQANAR